MEFLPNIEMEFFIRLVHLNIKVKYIVFEHHLVHDQISIFESWMRLRIEWLYNEGLV
jgi:hypothetical protein